MTVSGPEKLNDPEMLKWIQSWNEQDVPSQEVKTSKGKRKILLPTDIAEVTLSCFLEQVMQQKKELKICVTGEANINLNGTHVCGSNSTVAGIFTTGKIPRSEACSGLLCHLQAHRFRGRSVRVSVLFLVQKMSLITGFLVSAGGSSPILMFQMAALAMLVSEHSMLEISYPSTEKYLEEGRTLNLICHISHQQNEASQIEAHWYKRTNKHNETGFGKEMESFRLSQNSDPMAKVMSSLLLQIQNVNQSDSGRYQCRASIKNTVLTAVGHFIRVNVTERTEVDLEVNKALRVDSRLERMWAVFMISWIIMYVKGLIL
ncbi:uncharacterized protein [Pithys albifrons albifrons]|uniref:uncharacterized protein n=1 Tax=Pithys albifrons albifrons TaxID=3385563 RepID=UPI003A5CB292